jgi:hypothetical protein
MSEPPSAFDRLVTMAMLGAELERWRQQERFDQALRDAYANPAVTEPIVKAVGEAILKATDNSEVLVNVTLGSAAELAIAARSMKDMFDADPVWDDKEWLSATWEFKNGSAVCVRCKIERAKGV